MKLLDNRFTRGLLLVLLMIGFTGVATAQRTVTGTITDAENGDPLIGASVLVTGTSTGTITDFDGNFSLNVPANAESITFSYTGYSSSTVVIGDQTVFNIELSSGETLSEVVVIGYGSATREEISSAVTTIDEKDFNAGNVNDPAQLIQGKVAGLTISRPSGNPNGAATIRLRGISSFGANSSPLVIIDGVVGADLELIDPNDIASINVLKDGSAAAIYGIQASAGVIIVTTKTGKPGKTQVDYRGYVAAENIAERPNVADAGTYLDFVEQVRGRDFREAQDYGANTNWIDEISRTGISHVHNLSYSGGAGNTTFRASANYRDIQGIGIERDGFQQINGRLNVTQKAFNDRLNIRVDLTATDRDAEFFQDAAFRYAVTYNPAAPVRVGQPGTNVPQTITDVSNDIYGGFFEVDNFDYNNPVSIVQNNFSEGSILRTLVNVGADLDIIDGLVLSTNFSRQREAGTYAGFATREARFGGNAAGAEANRGFARRNTDLQVSDLFESTLTYDVDISNSTGLKLLAGYSWQEYGFEGFNISGNGLPTNATTFNNIGSLAQLQEGQANVFSYKDEYRVIGFFGRAQVSFLDNTYNLTASLRRDGTSRNGPESRFDWFPAVSASADLVKALNISGVNQLKLRAGYGITGSIPNGNYDYVQRFAFDPARSYPIGGSTVTSINPTSNFDPALAFERKAEINVGLDFAFLDYRLTGSVDYYTRNISNLLFNAEVSTPPFLFTNLQTNLNQLDLVASGVELSLSYLMGGQDSKFSYQPTLTLATFSNRIEDNGETARFPFGDGTFIELGSSSPGAPGQNDDPIARVYVGEQFGQLYGLQVDEAATAAAGAWVYVNQNGDLDEMGNPIINGEDKVLVGNGLPEFSLGLQNSFSFGDLDFSIFLRGDFGHDLANMNNNFYGNLASIATRGIDNVILHDNFREDVVGSPRFSDAYVEDASFLAIDNAQIGYTFRLPEGSGFRTIRPYVAGQNLHYFTGYSGVDPNIRYANDGNPLVNGLDRRNTYFRTRTFTFGVNVGF